MISYFFLVLFVVFIFAQFFYQFTLWGTTNYLKIEFEENRFRFIKKYKFRFSSVYKSGVIEASQINELCFPPMSYPYIIINSNEIVFVDKIYPILEKEWIEFAERNNIPITNREDTFQAILRIKKFWEYKWYLIRICKFSKKELLQISQKIPPVWESDYYQGDGDEHRQILINRIFLSKDYYWWSMKIALKGWNSIKKIN